MARVYGGMTPPSTTRSSRRVQLSKQLQQLDVSGRSADKKSFLIKRSASKTRTFVEAEEKTLDLQQVPVRRIKVVAQPQTEKKRMLEDMPSLRTVTTAKAQFQARKSFQRSEPSNVFDTLTVTKQVSQAHLMSSRPAKQLWPEKQKQVEKPASFYERVQMKVGKEKPERSAPIAAAPPVMGEIDRLVGTKASEASIYNDFFLSNKEPVRKKGILKNFQFVKRKPQNKYHMSMAIEDKIKFAVITYKEQVEFQTFLAQRSLLMLTQVRGKLLENRIGRDKPFNPYAESPVNSRQNIEEAAVSHEDTPLIIDSDLDDDELLEDDFKRFNYVINFKQHPSNAAAVFTNLDEAIEGHIHFCLTKTDPLYSYPTDYLGKLYSKDLAENWAWIGSGCMNISVDSLYRYMPTSVSKELEVDLIIRDKRAKRFQAVYVEENGKMNNDNFEAITLWGYQINKILSRDLEKDFDEFKLTCNSTAELRKLSTAIIKHMYGGLEEELDLPIFLTSSKNPITFKQFIEKEFNTQFESHLNNIIEIEKLIARSNPDNKGYALYRFLEAHKEQLELTYEKMVFVGELGEYSPSLEDDQLTSKSGSYRYRNNIPNIVINTIGDKSHMDIDSDHRISVGLPSPINADERFASKLE